MFLEMPVEIGEVLKATLVTDLRNTVIALHQEPAGVADTDFRNIVGKRLPCVVLEVTGERGNAHI